MQTYMIEPHDADPSAVASEQNEGASPYSRDLKNIETHLLDTGHLALETHGEEIATRIENF
jgi:hypothetical protein